MALTLDRGLGSYLLTLNENSHFPSTGPECWVGDGAGAARYSVSHIWVPSERPVPSLPPLLESPLLQEAFPDHLRELLHASRSLCSLTLSPRRQGVLLKKAVQMQPPGKGTAYQMSKTSQGPSGLQTTSDFTTEICVT